MYIILPTLPDPTDIVVQGDQNIPVDVFTRPTGYWPILQGWIPPAEIGVQPIPVAMIGQHDWYGVKPRIIGPMVVTGGQLVMLQIGAVATNPIIDPIQSWLNSQIQLDLTGAMWCPLEILPLNGDPGLSWITQGGDIMDDITGPSLPRAEIAMSRPANMPTYPVTPPTFMQVMQDVFNDSNGRWTISGVTRDKANNPIAGVRVMAFDYDKFNMNYPFPAIVGDTISDASGNYSMQIKYMSPRYMVIAYLAGNPDVVGVTTDDIQPVMIG
jgi:hypothetical protein